MIVMMVAKFLNAVTISADCVVVAVVIMVFKSIMLITFARNDVVACDIAVNWSDFVDES